MNIPERDEYALTSINLRVLRPFQGRFNLIDAFFVGILPTLLDLSLSGTSQTAFLIFLVFELKQVDDLVHILSTKLYIVGF